MFDHLLESSQWDDSYKWSNLGFSLVDLLVKLHYFLYSSMVCFIILVGSIQCAVDPVTLTFDLIWLKMVHMIRWPFGWHVLFSLTFNGLLQYLDKCFSVWIHKNAEIELSENVNWMHGYTETPVYKGWPTRIWPDTWIKWLYAMSVLGCRTKFYLWQDL